MFNRSNSYDSYESYGSVDFNAFDPNDGFMSHIEEMEKDQKTKDLSNINSFFVFLKNAMLLIESAKNVKPIERMEIVEKLEEKFKGIDTQCYGKIGSIIGIIIANVFKTSEDLAYTDSTQQDLSLVFHAANHIITFPPKQTYIDFLFPSEIKKLPPTMILEYIQQNIDNVDFSDGLFQLLKEKTTTEYTHGTKHSSRDAMIEEREVTPTFSIEELSDTPISDDINVSEQMNKRTSATTMTLAEMSTIFVDKIINSRIGFFQGSSPKINQVVPVGVQP